MSTDQEEFTQLIEKGEELFNTLRIAAENVKDSSDPPSIPDQKKWLKDVFSALAEPIQYKEGDFVIWRDRMKNKVKPKYGQPALVVEILENPLMESSKDTGSQYFNEPLNVRLGFIDDDGDFVSYLFDGRRFKKSE